MKKLVFLLAVLGLFILTCSKKNITNNYYYGPEEEGASIVGVVYPPESKATVTACLGIPVASTQIDTNGYFKLSSLYAGTYSLMVEAPGYFDYTIRANLYVAANTITSVDTVYMRSIHDLISHIRPYNGERNVDVGIRIMVVFQNVMNEESVEEAFHIDPVVEGYFLWYGIDPLQSQSYMQFSPREVLATSTSYQITIDTSASDTAGIKLLEPFQFSFITEPVRVKYTDPAHNDAWVSPSTEIRISFNCLMNMESVESAFELVDSKLNVVEGDLSWQNPTYIHFRPGSVLATKETYTASVNPTAEDASGNRIQERYWFSFVTQPVLVSSTSPSPRSTMVLPHIGITIRFNTDMDMESVDSAFRLMDSQQEQVSGRFSWGNLYQMAFKPDAMLNYNETYTVTIDTTAKDMYGMKLEEPFSFWFKTASE